MPGLFSVAMLDAFGEEAICFFFLSGLLLNPYLSWRVLNNKAVLHFCFMNLSRLADTSFRAGSIESVFWSSLGSTLHFWPDLGRNEFFCLSFFGAHPGLMGKEKLLCCQLFPSVSYPKSPRLFGLVFKSCSCFWISWTFYGGNSNKHSHPWDLKLLRLFCCPPRTLFGFLSCMLCLIM